MPIYEYRCGACGFQKEFLQRLSDAPLKDCPECGKAALSKMVTAAGFQLKGSGWYATDFKNGQAKSKPADKAEAKTDDKPAAKEGAAQETKPATETAAEKAPAKAETTAPKPAPAATPATNS
jgi:putative FmdB family regulatory protein